MQKIGMNANIFKPSYISSSCGVLVIGDNISINRNTTIDASDNGFIRIGNDVLIGQNVVIRASNHKFDKKSDLIREQGHKGGIIIIGNDVWIGANCVILPGAIIKDHSIIGAGSIVTKTIDEYCIAVGNPAKIIKRRNLNG